MDTYDFFFGGSHIGSIIAIFFFSFSASLLAEGFSWLLIYRTEDYQRLKSSIDRMQKKLDKKKEVAAKLKSKDKKVDRFEESLKTSNRDMAMSKFKSTFAVGFMIVGLFAFLNSRCALAINSQPYDGKIVAKLPFEPWNLLTGVTHRNVPGTDYTDCSMVFIYALSSIAVRTNLQKLLGFAPPRQPFGTNPSFF